MGEPAVRQPNETLRAIRRGLLMSQGEFALAIRGAGERAGEPNDCSKRLVGVPVVIAEKTTNIANLRGCGLDR